MSKFPWEVSAISAIVGIGVGYGVKSYLDKKGSTRENPASSKLDEVKALLRANQHTLNAAKDSLEFVLSEKDRYLDIADVEERFNEVEGIIQEAFEKLDSVLTEESDQLKAILDTCSDDEVKEIFEYIEKDVLPEYYELEKEIFDELEFHTLTHDDIDDEDEEELEEEEELEDLVSTKVNKDHAQRIIDSMKHQLVKHAKKTK